MKGGENYITPAERQALQDFVPLLRPRKWRVADIQFAFRLAYSCGLRMAEVPDRRASDFDWQSRQVYLGRTKTRANYAPIPDRDVAWMQLFWEEREKMPGRGGTALLPGCSVKRIYRWLKKAGDELDIPALTTPQEISGEKAVCHIFRKSLGKDMLEGTFGKKAPISVVQAQLRHSNPNMTGRYLRRGTAAAQDYWEDVGDGDAADGGVGGRNG